MARQATRLWAQCPPPGVLISLAGAVGAAAAVTPDLSADSRGRSFEALCDPPYRPTGGNASRNLFALLKPQRYQSPPAWRWSNPAIASQDPIDAALGPPLKRPRDVRHTLTALPALPQLGLLFRREPCPCMPLHSRTSLSAKIRRCCVDSLNSPPESGHSIDGPACLLGPLSRRKWSLQSQRARHNCDTRPDSKISYNRGMNENLSRELLAWLTQAGLAGTPESDIFSVFCDRCVAAGIP